nr:cache domain-containing protein [Candidatus Sigynarchaeota archaeon]
MNQSQKPAKYRRIKDKIILAFVVAVIVPLGVLSVVSLGNFLSLGNSIAGRSGTALDEEETRAMQSLSFDKAVYINESFSKVYQEVEILTNYAQDLFNNRINATVRPSFYHDIAASGVQPPDYVYDYNEYQRWISWNYSGYVIAPSAMDGISHPWLSAERNVTINSLINRSSNLDVLFRQMKATTPDYTWLYMGFQIGFHRSYPFHLYPNPYDPRARPWYQLAKNNTGHIVFTSPYVDASGTGLMVTAAKTVTNESSGNALIGIVAVDLRITTLRQNILQAQYLNHGYGFLIDRQGNTIVHPNMTTGINKNITTLETADPSFLEVLEGINSGSEGFANYTKAGNLWVIAYYPVAVTNYSMAIVCPMSDVLEPATSIFNQTLLLTGQQFGIFVGVLIAAIACIIAIVNFVAKGIVKPVKDLTTLVGYIQKGDLSREVGVGKNKKNEIGMLVKAFSNLTTILRFGNRDYYQGDLDRAFSNYLNALEFFQTTDNKKGEGIALSNMANVYHLWKDFSNAKDCYEKAIKIARELGDNPALANRLNNLAALLSETGHNDIAAALYAEALAIDNQTGDLKGKAQRLRNMALMHIGAKHFDSAKKNLDEARVIDEQNAFNSGLCYDLFYAGLLAIQSGNAEDGIDGMEKALEASDNLEAPYLRLNILKELATSFKFAANKAKAHKYRTEFEALKRKVQPKKFIVFVIDCSGSMQSRIKAAKEGAKFIFETQINPQDEVAIITFHSIYEILLPPTLKGGNEAKILKIIDDISNTIYQTAFYDSLGVAIDFLNKNGGNEQKWIIALTDGQDNSSTRFTVIPLSPFQQKLQKVTSLGTSINDNLLALNMIIVGIGNELRLVEANLRELVGSIKRGTYIPVPESGDVSKQIKSAFHEIGEILAEMEVENFDVFVDEQKGEV